MNNKATILMSLKQLGLTPDEAKVYLVLVDQSMSHLEIARRSGVNRTKVYRIADDLIKRGLITEETTDKGRELAANDPANLEIALSTAEAKLKNQKAIYAKTLPTLQAIYKQGELLGDHDFAVNTYDGTNGFKQMLWNELKAKDQLLVFGSGTLQDLIDSPRWAENHRAKTLEAGYKIREILNPDGKPENFTTNAQFVEKAYSKRYIVESVLPLQHQISIYNNTVATYHWRDEQKVGVEIINKDFANMQRAIFESYWQLAA